MSVSASSGSLLSLLQTARATATAAPSLSAGEASKPSAREEFDRFASMSPAERMRAAILQQVGVTEEQLAAMSPDERKALEAKITDRIKDQALQTAKKSGDTGLLADIRA